MALGGENEIWWFYPSGNSLEIDRYVGYNYADNHWLLGNLARTAGAARGVFATPIMSDHTTVTNLQILSKVLTMMALLFFVRRDQ